MKDITNKLVLVTGGASGLGRLMSLDFARRGARVAVWDLSSQSLAALAAEASAEGLSIKTAVCDVSDRKAVYKQAAALTASEGPLAILINCAGVVSGKTLLETPDERLEKTMQVNVFSLFWTVKAFLPGMIQSNSGHIVTMASAAGLIGVKGLADYCASKFAAVGFDEAVRMELRNIKSAVRTTVVCPFFTDTGMFKGVKTRFPLLLPILKPEVVAAAIVKAVLKNKRRLIMPWFAKTVLPLRMFPAGFLDFVADFFGINHAMDEFTGRQEQKAARAAAKAEVKAAKASAKSVKAAAKQAAKKPAAGKPAAKKPAAKPRGKTK
jgi:all-trans-retinol dehydrogenase (NAD+)